MKIIIMIMFLKIEETPNPNTLKFIPEKSLDFKNEVNPRWKERPC